MSEDIAKSPDTLPDFPDSFSPMASGGTSGMTLMRNVQQKNPVTGIGVTQLPENLNILAAQDCAAAIWERQPLPDF